MAEQRWVEISVEVAPDAVDDVVGLLSRYCTGGAVVGEEQVGAAALAVPVCTHASAMNPVRPP